MNELMYFIITIGILVFVHEFGHFAAAKLSKMRTDVFAIGFGKRLFGWNKINGFTFGDLPEDIDLQGHTDYRISLIPLGGYVKIAGMIDETMDKDFAKTEPKPWEFRSKNTFQKLFVISAGVLMNLLLTLIIFWGINFYEGKPVINSTKIGYLADTSKAFQIGFKTGDEIISVNNIKVADWQQVVESFLIESLGNDILVQVKRKNKTESIKIQSDILKGMKPDKFFLPLGERKTVLAKVLENTPASIAGLQTKDTLISINGLTIYSQEMLREIVSANSLKAVSLKILRGKDTISQAIVPDSSGKLGVFLVDIYTGKFETKTYGFAEAALLATTDIFNYTLLTYNMVKKVFVGKIEFGQAFGGPKKIAQFAAKSADSGLSSFLRFLAMLSLSLALINIFPLPALDGGHLIIIALEGIIRRELPIKFKIAIQNIGFVLLLALMAFILYSDFFGA